MVAANANVALDPPVRRGDVVSCGGSCRVDRAKTPSRQERSAGAGRALSRTERLNGTYEEYHPFGTTSWWATDGGTEVSAKRYRYTGKERDDETGLGYHGARYYAAWLGRWERPDPAGMVDGPNRYAYCRGNPVSGVDPTGMGTQQTGTATYNGEEIAAYGDESNPAEEIVVEGKQSVWEQIKAEPGKFLRDVFRVFREDALHIHLSKEEEAVVAEASTKFARGAADSAATFVTNPYSPVNWGLTPVLGAENVEMAANQVVSGQLDAALGAESQAPGDYFYEGGKSSEQAVSLARLLAGAATMIGATRFRPGPAVKTVDGRLPINYRWAGKTYPASLMPAELRGRYPHGVPFTQQGFPDFARYRIARVQIKLTGSRPMDDTAANLAAGLRRTPKGYTWHHHQVEGVMELIPTDLHNWVRHTGGAAVSGLGY
ncbi:MAG: HNH endonuclease [Alphaproteobacteria bacterium]|nr:HNH endonuclease [Alphaproteobacteria bacterium]MCB9694548.1 HNH endonuclease [Alphaproteobacteria bacterium]